MHEEDFLKTRLCISFDFFQKTFFFPKFELLNSGCGLSAGVYGMRNRLLGDSFKPRPSLDCTPRRHIDFRTEGMILSFTLSKT